MTARRSRAIIKPSLIAFLLAALLPLVAAGCGGPRLYPVAGKIIFADGEAVKDLAGGVALFDPIDGKAGAQGEIQPDGSFHLTTLQPGDGAFPGSYRVCIAPPLPDLDKRGKRVVVSKLYEDFKTSPLRVQIKAEANQVTLTVERAGAKR